MMRAQSNTAYPGRRAFVQRGDLPRDELGLLGRLPVEQAHGLDVARVEDDAQQVRPPVGA